ncbi:MAG TPA: hypothetical protein V6C57_09600 [Coleofasciculaceae cyanobacterium]
MKLTTTYRGGEDPFEGDRTVWLRALPAGAIVTRATLTLKPAQRAVDAQFQETFTFGSAANAGELLARDWGIIPVTGQAVEIDFHARRTLAAVEGTGGSLTLQVDLGGAYVGVANDGTLIAPGKTPLPVNFSTTPTRVNLPSLTVSKFRLSPTGTGTPPATVTRVFIRSAPVNLTVRLGQTPAFWTRSGDLTVADTSPDFTLLLNAFLLTAQPQNGFYAIPFIVHSASLARLDMSVAIEYRLAQSVLPPHLSELNATYGFSTLPSLDDPLTTVKIPQGAQLVAGQSTAKITGEFQPTRIALGLIGEEPAQAVVVEVSPDCSLAQLLVSDQEIEVTGFDLPLANTQPGLAGLNLSIQSDADGKPSGEVLKTMEVTIEKPLPGQSSWGSATLPSPFRILPGQQQRYWLILQSLVGKAFWLSVPAPASAIPLQCSRNGGLSWRESSVATATTALQAQFRLRTVPDRFTLPVQLQIGKGAHAVLRRLDEYAPLGRVEFDFDFTDKLRDYLDQATTASPCGAGELLINGSFDQPAPDDANRRVFGFDVAESDGGWINGKVDLSRGINLSQERFIRLTLEQPGSNSPATPVRIDCAGANPSRTSGLDIENRIDLAMHQDIADYYGGKMILKPPTGEPSPSLKLDAWYDVAVPQGWQKSSESRGQIGRLKLPMIPDNSVSNSSTVELPPQRIVAVLQSLQLEEDLPSTLPLPIAGNPPPGTADLTQTIAVKAACTYLLQFQFLALAQSSQSEPPRWQVNWRDANQQLLKQDEGSLPAFSPRSGFSSSLMSGGGSAISATAVVTRSPTIVPVSVRLPAPPNAIQAEIRFEQPLGGILVLDDVSFAPTLESLSNANFSFIQQIRHSNSFQSEPLPVYWSLQSGWLDFPNPQDQQETATGIVLDGSKSPEDVVLVQTLPIQAGSTDQYRLQVDAFVVGGAIANIETRPSDQRARVELHWLQQGRSTVAIILPLDGQNFPEQGWSGAMPAGTTDAEIRLIQPKNNGRLQVNSVSLTRLETTAVPLIFLGESPGQLTISSLRVTYE